MIKRRMQAALVCASLLCLCACGKSDKPSPSSSATPGGAELPLVMETAIEKPKFVYLPEEPEDTANLIYDRQMTAQKARAEGGSTDAPDGKAVTKYQDVSEEENVVALEGTDGVLGQTVDVPLRLCGKVDLLGFDIRVFYNAAQLHFVDCVDPDPDLMFHCDETTGTILINYLRAGERDKRVDLGLLRFSPLVGNECAVPIEIKIVEGVTLDQNGAVTRCACTPVGGTVYLNGEGG